jgi:lipopolysaccharide transport system ATP-binding protein
MPDFAIQAEHVGKRYFLGEGLGRNYLGQAIKSVFPKAAIGDFQEFWAVRDASFTINQGEAVGVIGRNGAGKSTLLKMLSRVAAPTEGRIRLRGRVGTLLEVGTGFHPELTGRDNIFLSGTILGMSYAEVARKFDEIVAFSEIEGFIDTPVKRYSSGMYVRLAFAVASFLEPEILIVDEVLAVGDAAFQRKSLGRLNQVSEQDGRTVLFVSHNLSAIRTFCKRVLVLEKGRLVFDGDAEEGIARYIRALPERLDVKDVGKKDRLNRGSGAVKFTAVTATDSAGRIGWRVNAGETVTLRFEYEVFAPVPDLAFQLILRSALDGQTVTMMHKIVCDHPLAPGEKGTVEMVLHNLPLRPGEFSLFAYFLRGDDRVAYDAIDANVDLPFLAVSSPSENKYERNGIVSLPHTLRRL